jgi:hypothetical protein
MLSSRSIPPLSPYVSEPLSDFSSVTVLDNNLPAGNYRFMMALDDDNDGSPNPVWTDSVTIIVQ